MPIMTIMRKTNLINVHFWTYLNHNGDTSGKILTDICQKNLANVYPGGYAC